MSVGVLAHCPRPGCKAEMQAELHQEFGVLHELLLANGWHFDHMKREWRCAKHKERPTRLRLMADVRKEKQEEKSK